MGTRTSLNLGIEIIFSLTTYRTSSHLKGPKACEEEPGF